MAKISEGINKESKTKMASLLEAKKEQAQYLRNSIKEVAQTMVNECKILSSFWVNASISKLADYNRELAQLEAEMQLLTLYSADAPQE